MNIGVLALQGDFEAHAKRIRQIGHQVIYVRTEAELRQIHGLVMPGGESTAMLRLLNTPMKNALARAIGDGLPVLATCAGLILLAKRVRNPSQESLDILDIEVVRNAYGRQSESFVTTELEWTSDGRCFLESCRFDSRNLPNAEGVFIRAPRISQTGQAVETLLVFKGTPVMIRQANVIGLAFHPELSNGEFDLHQLFCNQIGFGSH
ncbi:MAG: pyridoxal 5'-phosphate synthase glutaminase subunit PdxT [Bdellovibrionales bacterium]|nr:pyridoxal 5'-phosphate synthase glutaminase subunit PdxT [Bdellovibrionales bacterium]